MKAAVGTNHIGYRLLNGGTTTFRSLNPVTSEELPVIFHQATTEETALALELADSAFGPYAEMPFAKRAAFLEAIAASLEKQAEPLKASFVLESGLPEDRAAVELKRTCFQLTSYAAALRSGYALHAVIDPGDPDRLPTPKPDLRKMNVAIGPVIVFGASNFPFAYSTAGGDVASALAAGCPVIVKGHPMHAQTSELVASLIVETAKSHDLPEGVFSHVHAIDFSVGEQLVKDERTRAVGFTGSFKGGMALHHLAQSRKHPIPVFAEMGSINPIVVLQEAARVSPETIAQKLVQSVSLNAGQFCTSPGLLFVTETPETEKLILYIKEGLAGMQPQSMLHPNIRKQYLAAKESQREGAAILSGDVPVSGNRILPALFSISGQQFLAEPHRQEEVFGSFLQIIRCTDQQELMNCLTVLNGQLTGSLFFEPSESTVATRVIALLNKKVGRIVFNGVPTGVEVSPAMQHGGVFPASTDSRFTAVGSDAITRFMRPVVFQNCPDELLPEPLKRTNPSQILRFVNGLLSPDAC